MTLIENLYNQHNFLSKSHTIYFVITNRQSKKKIQYLVICIGVISILLKLLIYNVRSYQALSKPLLIKISVMSYLMGKVRFIVP